MSEWSKKLVIKFLEAYEGEPVIWNPKHPSHKDKTAVMNAWNRLSRILEIPTADIKRKKESLMAMYRTHLRKKKQSLKEGFGVPEYKPTWFAFKTMERFLGKVYDCEGLSDSEATESQLQSGIEHDHSAYGSTFTTSTPIASQPYRIEVPKRRSAHLELREANNLLKQAFAPFTNVLNQNQTQKEDDECDLFGRLIAKKLKRFNEEEREETMYEIETLIMKRKNPSALNAIYSSSSPTDTFVEGRVETELYCPASPEKQDLV